MSSIWERFIDSIRDDAGQLAKEELKLLIRDAVSDSDRFLQEQGRKMERYLTQLASDEITKEQFEGYMEDLRILTQMQARKMKVAPGTTSPQSLTRTRLLVHGRAPMSPVSSGWRMAT